MSVWIITITDWGDEEVSILPQGYKTYDNAKSDVLKKIDYEYLKRDGDYKFYDTGNNYTYELKSIFIK